MVLSLPKSGVANEGTALVLFCSASRSPAFSKLANLFKAPSEDTGLRDRLSAYFAFAPALATECVLALDCDRSRGVVLRVPLGRPFVREL